MYLRPILQEIDAACDDPLLERTRQVVPRAPAVDENTDADAALRGGDQRIGDGAPRLVVGENVRLEPDLAFGTRECLDQCGEILGAAAQQRHGVPRREAVHRVAAAVHDQRRRLAGMTSKVAASAA